MAEEISPVPTQFRQCDTPSVLCRSASQKASISNAVIRLQMGYSIDASKKYPPVAIPRNLHKECYRWLDALIELPKLEEVKKIEPYCQPALTTHWNEMRDNFVAAIQVFELSIYCKLFILRRFELDTY